MRTNNLLLASTAGQSAASKIFSVSDEISLDADTIDGLLKTITAARVEKPSGFLAVAHISEVNRSVERANKVIAELQELLASHGEGWSEVEEYVAHGTDRALQVAESEMRDYLRRARVPQVLHAQHIAAARASVDIAYYQAIAKALSDLRRANVDLEDVCHDDESWCLRCATTMKLYRERLQILTPLQAQDLAIWSAIYSLERVLEAHGVDVHNLRKSSDGCPSGQLLVEHYDPTADERVTTDERDKMRNEALSRRAKMFG